MKIEDEDGLARANEYQARLRACVQSLERIFPGHAVVLVVTPFRDEHSGRTQLHHIGNINKADMCRLFTKVIKGIRATVITNNKKLN